MGRDSPLCQEMCEKNIDGTVLEAIIHQEVTTWARGQFGKPLSGTENPDFHLLLM